MIGSDSHDWEYAADQTRDYSILNLSVIKENLEHAELNFNWALSKTGATLHLQILSTLTVID